MRSKSSRRRSGWRLTHLARGRASYALGAAAAEIAAAIEAPDAAARPEHLIWAQLAAADVLDRLERSFRIETETSDEELVEMIAEILEEAGPRPPAGTWRRLWAQPLTLRIIDRLAPSVRLRAAGDGAPGPRWV